MADDSPHVHARGANPDRVLLTGDGAATGRGVRTHDLGLPGYLARSLTARTERATDVDLIVDGGMTIANGLPSLEKADMSRYDIVVLSFGANEALRLMSATAWVTGMTQMLLLTADHVPAATKVFVLAVPRFGTNPSFPRSLARIVDRQVQVINAATIRIVALHPELVFVPESHEHAYELENAHLYRQWAEGIAERISGHLDPSRPQVRSSQEADEVDRRQALRQYEGVLQERRADLVDITRRARSIFGTRFAAINLIRSDDESVQSITDTSVGDLHRSGTFCDITIRRSGHLVIHDTTIDSRYSDYALVTGAHGIRFYAGYPLEDPQGHRIGALCVMDREPQPFTEQDAAARRSLALSVQAHLYSPPGDTP